MAPKNTRTNLIQQATRILPELLQATAAIAADPNKALAQAFPKEDPGLHPPHLAEARPAGADDGLESTPVRDTVQARRRRRLEAGRRAVEKLKQNKPDAIDKEELDGLEAIVLVTGRPAILFKNGSFLAPPPPWQALGNPPLRPAIEQSARSVGRIELEGHPLYPWVGTGFVVADRVLLTNRHVAKVFSEKSGRKWMFTPGVTAGIDFVESPVAGEKPAFNISEVIGIHDKYDLALLALAKARNTPPPLPVASKAPAPLPKRQVYVLGYPARDPRNGEAAMRDIFGDVFDVKRLQPGQVIKFFEDEGVFNHDASTLGGNSGSAAFDLQTHQVLGLHFGGVYLKYNRAVALWALTKDALVKKAKLNYV